MNNRRNIAVYIFIFLLVSVFIGGSLAYYYGSSNAGGSIALAELDFVTNYTAEIMETNLATKDELLCELEVVNCRANLSYNGLVGFFMRVYLESVIDGQSVPCFEPKLANNVDWLKHNGKYYYLKEVLPGEAINILTGVYVKPDIDNSVQGKRIVFNIVIEAVQSSYDAYKSEWPDAPHIY